MASRNTNESMLKYIDWTTVIIYLILVIVGAVSIYAASYDFDNANIFDFNEFSGKQLTWIGLSFILGLALLLVDFRVYETYAYPIYCAMILLLIVTIFIAKDINGSRSWLVLGPVSIQPAEFAKFATALALAKLFNGYNFKLNAKPLNYMVSLFIILLPVGLILAQKETGSALVYFSLFFVLYREGMSGLILFSALCAITYFVITVKYTDILFMNIATGDFIVILLIMIIMVGMLSIYCKKGIVARNVLGGFTVSIALLLTLNHFEINIPGKIYLIVTILVACLYCVIKLYHSIARRLIVVLSFVIVSIAFSASINLAFQKLRPHQQNRILVTLGIKDDLRGAGYNVNQSMIAIGSGGFSGKGFLNGTQTKLKYVPEQHTDFIFCTIGEEEGFLGSTITMLLFLTLILRVISIAERQPSTFGRVYGYCVASYFMFHFIINIGMVIGLCPVIGIPLPFISYGGSSLWGFTILLFILLRIDASRREHISYR